MTKIHEVGIVFSGGGIRGIAHLGVMRFLEEMGVRANVVAGSSSGALVAAFYAGGHSAEDALRFFLKHKPLTWRNYAPGEPGFLSFDTFEQALHPFFPEDKFSALPAALYLTRTNLETGSGEVVHQGSVIKNALASAALPPLFSPVEIDNILYCDGGITNNFPVEPLMPICEKTLGIYVNPLPLKPRAALSTTYAVTERAFHISVVHASRLKLNSCDVMVIPKKLEQYSLMDLGRIDEIFELGYEAAQQKGTQLEQLFNL